MKAARAQRSAQHVSRELVVLRPASPARRPLSSVLSLRGGAVTQRGAGPCPEEAGHPGAYTLGKRFGARDGGWAGQGKGASGRCSDG